MVGAAGFEPTTPSPPVKCATGLRYAPTCRNGSISLDLRTRQRKWNFYPACLTVVVQGVDEFISETNPQGSGTGPTKPVADWH